MMIITALAMCRIKPWIGRGRFLSMGRHRGGGDISDAALDAQKRVANALAYIGPGLADMVLAVCCSEIGLEATRKEIYPAAPFSQSDAEIGTDALIGALRLSIRQCGGCIVSDALNHGVKTIR